MSPILGIWGSKYTAVGNYYSIQTATVDSGGAATITFSSIPQTYTHLQLRCLTRTARGVNYLTGVYMNFNSDSTAGHYYATHLLYGTGASAGATVDNSSTYTYAGYAASANQTANAFGTSIVDILDYTNTSKNKTVRVLSGVDINGVNGEMDFMSGLWIQTSAINSITLTLYTGANFSQYSSIALYGIK